MDTAYAKLADHLSRTPNGFPRTESGVELKLLAKLFTPDEALLASVMNLEHETSGIIAAKHGHGESETRSLLAGMVKKGLIDLRKQEGTGLVFGLVPFVVGFYERQNAKIDREFAELFEAYYKESFHKVMIVDPSVHRIIPIEKTIPANIDVMPYEKASTYLDEAKSWGVLKCICRVQKKLVGEGCDHTVENCMAFSTSPGAFDRTEDIRAITREQAQEILAEAEREGLVHATGNMQEGINYICNCCICSCGVMRGMAEYGSLHSIARSDFYAVVDEELCSACETCIGRCQFKALKIEGDSCVVNQTFCFGCGLCVTSCTSGALSLQLKSPEELAPPPLTEKEWRVKRARNIESIG
jgi:NAD-dependent dihydropyrimidine dehydrogenase PreA subunit